MPTKRRSCRWQSEGSTRPACGWPWCWTRCCRRAGAMAESSPRGIASQWGVGGLMGSFPGYLNGAVDLSADVDLIDWLRSAITAPPAPDEGRRSERLRLVDRLRCWGSGWVHPAIGTAFVAQDPSPAAG